MADYKAKPFGVVIFFERNKDGAFDSVGQTLPLRYIDALDVYANTPNPASQLVGGDTKEEAMEQAREMVKKMHNLDYVQEYVDPYL